ncbi:probable G-protein coupled receptor 139 [Hypanus sabinus]|uniref:probable G-protein coupled receptor 139 n=1 Tax=Hypanus sabinus TaxID=79690 RepID=UPI0028C3FC6D|nr:probable G-protein coupled receptor 139 [Hypanus sabinus]
MVQPAILTIGDVFYKALLILGIPANVVTLLTLQLRDCGISKNTTIYLVSMATSDLLVLIFYVGMSRILVPHFPQFFRYYPMACRFDLIMMFAVVDCSVWLTVSFTFDRFVAICFQGFKQRYCTTKTAAFIVSTVYLLTYARNFQYYFTVVPYFVYGGQEIGCKKNPAIYSDPGWKAFYWLQTILTPFAPYVTIVCFNVLTIRHILVASRVRQSFHSDGASRDSEMQNRQRAMVFLFGASASFILLWMSTVGLFLFSRITNRYSFRNYNDPFAVINEMSRMLRILNCSSSTCMYALSQYKFREELKKCGKFLKTLIWKSTAMTK